MPTYWKSDNQVLEELPVDSSIKVTIYFENQNTVLSGLEILDEKGQVLLKTVNDDDKADPDISFYTFSINKGERIVGIKCRIEFMWQYDF